MKKSHGLGVFSFGAMALWALPAVAQGALPQPMQVPVTKVLAISHPTAKERDPKQIGALLHPEVQETVSAYLAGKIDQWYIQQGKPGIVLVLNAKSVDEAKAIVEQLPLDKAGFVQYEFIPMGPLSPLNSLLQSAATTPH